MMNKKTLTLSAVLLVIALIAVGYFFFIDRSGELEKVTIAIWDSYELETLKEYTKPLEEENIEVEVISVPWDEYWLSVENSLETGNGPDIFWMHTDMFEEYVASDSLLKMNNVLPEEYWENFDENLLSKFTYDNNRYVVPRDISVIGLFYNKDLFDAKDLEYPQEDWTWSDLVQASISVNDSENDVYGFLAECWGEDGYYNTIFQNNGYIYNPQTDLWGYSEPSTQEGVQFYLDFITEHNVSPTVTDILDTDTNELFMNDKVAMFFRGNWEIITFSQNEEFGNKFDVISLPAGESEATTLNTIGYAASSKSPNLDSTKKVLEYLARDEYYMKIAEDGVSIPAHKQYRNLWTEHYNSYNGDFLVNSIEYGQFMPNLTGVSNWKSIEEEILLEIFMGNKDLEEGLLELDAIYEQE